MLNYENIPNFKLSDFLSDTCLATIINRCRSRFSSRVSSPAVCDYFRYTFEIIDCKVMYRLKFIIIILLTGSIFSSCRTTNEFSRSEGTPLPGLIDNFPEWQHELMADTLKVDMKDHSAAQRDGMIWDPGDVKSRMPVLVPNEMKYFYHLKIYQPKNNDGWYSPDYRNDYYRRHEEPQDSTKRVW